jgi:hypothetical protein
VRQNRTAELAGSAGDQPCGVHDDVCVIVPVLDAAAEEAGEGIRHLVCRSLRPKEDLLTH